MREWFWWIPICPTHVGMNRWRKRPPSSSTNLPHARGDEPYEAWRLTRNAEHLPHARGDEPPILPTALASGYNLSHARGDEPYDVNAKWPGLFICPTHVGMNRLQGRRGAGRLRSAPRTWG